MDVDTQQRMEFVFSSDMAVRWLFYNVEGRNSNKHQYFVVSARIRR